VGDVIGGVPYPKSGHMGNSQGKIVAKIIASRIAGKEYKPTLPDNTCYSMVNGSPQEAIVINERSEALAKATYEWARSMYKDMFA
jgi:NADH dehydrogenase FAD-containing subunit